MKRMTVIVVLSMAMISVAHADMTDGLIAHFTFDDGTAADVTGNGHDGILHGTPTPSAGRFGQAFLFDRYDYIEVTNTDAFRFANQSATISLWATVVDNANSSYTFMTIGDDGESPNVYWQLGKTRSGDENGHIAAILIESYHPEVRCDRKSDLSGPELPKNEWMHIVSVLDQDSGEIRLFIDGVEQFDSYSGSSTLIDSSQFATQDPLYVLIGGLMFDNWSSPAGNHIGLIDDVRIYDRALSATEIQEMYVVAIPAPGACLLGCLGVAISAAIRRRIAS